jgi:putative transposase
LRRLNETNVHISRRAVKYEDIYLNEYATVPTLDIGLSHYFPFYNTERLHQSLSYRVPAEVHFGLKPYSL